MKICEECGTTWSDKEADACPECHSHKTIEDDYNPVSNFDDGEGD